MAREQFPLAPQITVNDTVVKAGPLSWGGVKTIRDKIKASGLELPKIEFGSGQKNLSLLTLDDLAEFVQRNLGVLAQWVGAHPELVQVLILDGSNVPPDAVDTLSAAEALAVAQTVLDASVADGLFTNYARFFGGLLAPLFRAPEADAQAEPVDYTIAPASGAAGPSTTSTN